MGISLNDFCDVLDDMEILHSVDKSAGTIDFGMEADDKTIRFIFTVDEEQEVIQGAAILCEKDIIGSNDFHEAYKFCSQWNSKRRYPRAYVSEDSKSIVCDWTWDTDTDYSDELIKNVIVLLFVKGCKMCFDEAMENGLYAN